MTGEKLLKELRAFIEKQKMKQTKNKLLSGILIFGLITNLLVLFDIQYFYLRAIFSFIFLITIPRLLIMLMLKIRKIGFCGEAGILINPPTSENFAREIDKLIEN